MSIILFNSVTQLVDTLAVSRNPFGAQCWNLKEMVTSVLCPRITPRNFVSHVHDERRIFSDRLSVEGSGGAESNDYRFRMSTTNASSRMSQRLKTLVRVVRRLFVHDPGSSE